MTADGTGAAPPLAHTERVAVLAPTAADARLTRSLLAEAGVACVVAGDAGALAASIREGVAVALLTDAALADPGLAAVADALREQPAWSDVPVLLTSGAGVEAAPVSSAVQALRNVTLLDRPVRVATLVSAVRSAIRARRRQYQLRDQVDELAQAEAALRRQGERLRLLWACAAHLLANDDEPGMVRALHDAIAPHLMLDACLLHAPDEAGVLRLSCRAGIAQAAAAAPAAGTCGEADAGAWTNVASAANACPPADAATLALAAIGMRARCAFALVADGRHVGTLSFGSARRDAFDAEEVEFLRTVADCATLALERLRLIRQLRDSDRRKDEFLATLAHELRNPLAPIQNAVEILRRADGKPATLETARRMIGRQVTQMVRLIDDLLDVSRISRGKLALRREPVEIASVVAQAVEVARPLLEAANHRLEIEMPGEPIVLDADPVRLAQVLSNLLNNAAKYTEPGGRIRLVVDRGPGETRVTVEDNGIGIPPSALRSVFDMFTQVDRAVEKAAGGLGIGLTLVKRLTEMHGGSVEARSAGPGQGSAFVVRLPFAEPPPPSEHAAQGATPVAARPAHRVLVADDNPDAVESLGIVLQLLGQEVRTASDGEQAIEVARDFQPDLALLDVGMPRVSGYEAARRIRAEAGERAPMLVAVTGWGQEQDRRRAFDAGFDRHYTKPLQPKDLDELLATLDRRAVPSAAVAR